MFFGFDGDDESEEGFGCWGNFLLIFIFMAFAAYYEHKNGNIADIQPWVNVLEGIALAIPLLWLIIQIASWLWKRLIRPQGRRTRISKVDIWHCQLCGAAPYGSNHMHLCPICGFSVCQSCVEKGEIEKNGGLCTRCERGQIS